MAGGTTNTFLFVYGSLQPGAWNHRMIEQYVRRATPGTIRGILVDLGRIPALIAGNGLVHGILLEVDPAALEITDRLEGHPRWYVRKETTVTRDDGSTIRAWVYECADPPRLVDCPHLTVGWEDDLPVHAWRHPLSLESGQ